jgi:hypothetical protein
LISVEEKLSTSRQPSRQIKKVNFSLSTTLRPIEGLDVLLHWFFTSALGGSKWLSSWLRRLVAGFSPRRPGFDPGSVRVGLVVDKVALYGFSPSTSVFPCQFHSTGVPLLGKTKKTLIIFITGLHNKLQGCGASVVSAAGPFTKKWLSQSPGRFIQGKNPGTIK